jgi:predicted RNA binding protein YcfA (HicA-like mRNA interferase family)
MSAFFFYCLCPSIKIGYTVMKVREVLRILSDDGWIIVRWRGSHRQLKHPVKPGRVTVPGKESKDLAPGTQKSIFRQAGLEPPDG